MFKITTALYFKLYKAYQSKGCWLYHRGNKERPESFFTTNISFTLDTNGSTATVKCKYNKQQTFANQLQAYIKSNYPTQLVG